MEVYLVYKIAKEVKSLSRLVIDNLYCQSAFR